MWRSPQTVLEGALILSRKVSRVAAIGLLAGSLFTAVLVAPQADDLRLTSASGGSVGSSTDADETTYAPRSVEVANCASTSGYAIRPALPSDVLAVLVDPAKGVGGPVAVLTGSGLPGTQSLSSAPRTTFVPRNLNGVARWFSAEGGHLATLQTKRMPESQFRELVVAVTSTGSPPAGLSDVGPPGSAEVAVLGTSCEVGDRFYGVEVIRGDLAARAVYSTSIDPSQVDGDGAVSIAVFNPRGPGEKLAVRIIPDPEWQSMRANSRADQGKAALPADILAQKAP